MTIPKIRITTDEILAYSSVLVLNACPYKKESRHKLIMA